MPNVKLFLTPYQFVKGDEVQTFFQTAQNGGDFVLSCVDGIFARRLQPGLDFLLEPLMQGVNQNWWRNMRTNDPEPYGTVRTVGMYNSSSEPSLAIDLDLVDQNHAVDLIRTAAQFGVKFNQFSVHVLFSLRGEAVQTALLQIQPEGKGQPATSYLATYRNVIRPQTILDEARALRINALTVDVSLHQLQYHYKNSDAGPESAKWNNLMNRLDGGEILNWDAMLFAIGSGPECTSRYNQWNVNGVHSTIRNRVNG